MQQPQCHKSWPRKDVFSGRGSVVSCAFSTRRTQKQQASLILLLKLWAIWPVSLFLSLAFLHVLDHEMAPPLLYHQIAVWSLHVSQVLPKSLGWQGSALFPCSVREPESQRSLRFNFSKFLGTWLTSMSFGAWILLRIWGETSYPWVEACGRAGICPQPLES